MDFFSLIIYLTIIFLTVLFCYLGYKKNSKLMLFIAILIPSFFAGIRYNVGTDYLAVYYPYYKDLVLDNITVFNGRMELGFNILCKIVIWLNLGFPFLMFICEFITMYFILKALNKFKNKISVPLGLFIYMVLYYQFSLNAVRQAISMSIFLYSITYLLEKKYLKYCFLILIATLFHKTALIGLLMIPFLEIFENRNRKFARYTMYFIMLIMMINFDKIGIFLSNIDSLSYYSGYLLSKKSTGININYFIRVAIYIMPYVLLTKDYKKDCEMNFLFAYLVIGSLFRLLAYLTSTYGERIALFFLIEQIIVVPYSIKNINNKKMILPIIIFCYLYLWYHTYFISLSDQTVPYLTIFN